MDIDKETTVKNKNWKDGIARNTVEYMSTIIRIELNVFNSKNTIRDNRNNLTPC
jgi:hypothetical protein